jgi:hypothetical protein
MRNAAPGRTIKVPDPPSSLLARNLEQVVGIMNRKSALRYQILQLFPDQGLSQN